MTDQAADPGTPPTGENMPINSRKNPYAARPLTAAAVTVLVAGSIICTLVVPIYASTTPKIGDWPFFYFYLLVYMPAVALALWVTTLLQRRLRPADHGAPGAPSGPGVTGSTGAGA